MRAKGWAASLGGEENWPGHSSKERGVWRRRLPDGRKRGRTRWGTRAGMWRGPARRGLVLLRASPRFSSQLLQSPGGTQDLGFPERRGGAGTVQVSKPPAGGAHERRGWSLSPSHRGDSGSRRASCRSAGVSGPGSPGSLAGGQTAWGRRRLRGWVGWVARDPSLQGAPPPRPSLPAIPRASSLGWGPSSAPRRGPQWRVQGRLRRGRTS